MADFKFYDYSPQVKQAIENIAVAWLHTWAGETAAQAKRNTSTEGWTNAERTSLCDSYSYVVDEAKKEAQVGTPMEQGYWEEFGTGSHADTAKNGGRQGRQDWWVYVENSDKPDDAGESTHYRDKAEAEEAVAYIKREYGKTAHATNGREPNYTLEKSFVFVEPKAKKDLQDKLKGL